MNFYPDTTLLPPSPMDPVDFIIFELWNRHLELEIESEYDTQSTRQHLEVTTAVIDYWEGVISEINASEIRKRRSDSCKDS